MDLDFLAPEAPTVCRGVIECLSDLLEGAPVKSGPKGKLRAEIEGRGEGSFLPPQGETKAVSWGIPLDLVEVKLEF